MKHELIVKPKAKQDIVGAASSYKSISQHLGDDFLLAIGEGFERIRESPELYARRLGEIRQFRIRRFPYIVSYVVEENRIYVLAVIHGNRDSIVQNERETNYRNDQIDPSH